MEIGEGESPSYFFKLTRCSGFAIPRIQGFSTKVAPFID
jgi:hypothetical protein